jgi:hypothetical protein
MNVCVLRPEALQVGLSTYILLAMIFEPNQLKAFTEKLIRSENHHHLSIDVAVSSALR